MKGVIKMGRDEYGHYINDEGVEKSKEIDMKS